MLLFTLASAHDFAIITLGPNEDWCEQLHAQAAPADVVKLLPGSYPGGCDLTLGGLIDLNEALLVQAEGGEVVIEPDQNGLSLRTSGEPTRLFGLTLQGRLEVAADGTTLDTSTVGELAVDPSVNRIAVLWSTLPAVELELESAVVRGNALEHLNVLAVSGLVGDNVITGDANSSIRFERNLVLGVATVEAEAYANVFAGPTAVAGPMVQNTALDTVDATDAWNNLTTVASLPPNQGNLACATCLGDPDGLDVRPGGQALDLPPAATDGPRFDFCGVPIAPGIGAITTDVEPLRSWSALDRDRDGCSASLRVPPPPLPPTSPTVQTPDRLPEPAPTGCASVQPSAGWGRSFFRR